MKKTLALILAVMMVISMVAVSSAAMKATIANSGSLGLECPAIPSMYCKNDGVTQYVVISEPMEYLSGVWNWQWVNVEWTNEEMTEGKLDMHAVDVDAQQGYGTWGTSSNYFDKEAGKWVTTWVGAGTYSMGFAYDGATKDGANVRYDSHGNAINATVKMEGTEYFGRGVSTETTVVWEQRLSRKNKPVWFISQVTEKYEDNSSSRAKFTQSGECTGEIFVDANGKKIEVYSRGTALAEQQKPAEEEKPAEETPAEDTPVEGGNG